MVKKCSECGRTLLCFKCKESGAFDGDAPGKPIHKGACVYELCGHCQGHDHEKQQTSCVAPLRD